MKKRASAKKNTGHEAANIRPWGSFQNLDHGNGWFVKTLRVSAGKRLSLQYHRHRSEYWMLVEGDAIATIRTDGDDSKEELSIARIFFVPKGAIHRLESKNGAVVVEISYGNFNEEDIVRVEDDYGRAS
jgi:mannose-6-phosphate isomerase